MLKAGHLEALIEKVIFASRWLLAPIYLCIISVLVAFIYFIAHDLFSVLLDLHSVTDSKLIITALGLCDMVLIANLVIIVVISGYENFVSKLDINHKEGEPTWIKKLQHSDVKLKIAASIVAISSIKLLQIFLEAEDTFNQPLIMWSIILHITFVVSALLIAVIRILEAKVDKNSKGGAH
jgi:uncharacterized protein (TIGR00645 family)